MNNLPACRFVSSIAALLLGAAVAVIFCAPASADDPFHWESDLGEHSYCFHPSPYDLPPAAVDRAILAMNTVAYQTVVDVLSKGWTCGPHTDVRFQEYFISEGVAGSTNCIHEEPQDTCDRFSVTISMSVINDAASNPNNQVRNTLCHEIGHTLGVNHYRYPFSPDGVSTQSCMRSFAVHDAGTWDQWSYGKHHVNEHVNRRWS